eukprot:4138940-Pyramimonas_sp.AAC.1
MKFVRWAKECAAAGASPSPPGAIFASGSGAASSSAGPGRPGREQRPASEQEGPAPNARPRLGAAAKG